MRIAIMPARGGSKRIGRKNLVDFCGRPLLSYPLAAAKQSGLFDLIHVSTEDREIAATATQLGFPPDFPRDSNLADDFTPLLPVLQWVLQQYAARNRRFDTVCLLMPTAPLIEASDLVEACALFDRNGKTRPVLAAATLPCPVEWALRLKADGSLVTIGPDTPKARSQDLDKAYYDSGTFIFFSADQVLRYPADQPAYLAYVLPRHKAIDINDPEDLELAERLFRGRR